MPQNLVEQLRKVTTVVADTGEIEAMEEFKPTDATTNPSLITAAVQMPQYQPIVDDVLKEARNELGEGATDKDVANLAFKRLAIAFGKKILQIVPGRVSTEVDARLSFDTDATIAQGPLKSSIFTTRAGCITNDHVLIKIASTWEGIRAAEVLEKEGIHCNLTLLFGIHQAIACADAGVTLISPFVGRILDWYKKDTGKDFHGADDPGVQVGYAHLFYFKKYGYKTEVMGASFRNIGEITELAGCDRLPISPQLLAELEKTEGDLPRRNSTPSNAHTLSIRANRHRPRRRSCACTLKIAWPPTSWQKGIAGFSAALEKLEGLLAARLAALGVAHAGNGVSENKANGSAI